MDSDVLDKDLYRKVYGIVEDTVGVKHYAFRTGPASYPFGVLPEQTCPAHPWGTSLLIDGQWFWRDGDATLRPLAGRNQTIIENMVCVCK